MERAREGERERGRAGNPRGALSCQHPGRDKKLL